jgi:hypothetical protein
VTGGYCPIELWCLHQSSIPVVWFLPQSLCVKVQRPLPLSTIPFSGTSSQCSRVEKKIKLLIKKTPRISFVYYYETINRKTNRILIYECRCDERLKVKTEGPTRLTYTGLHGGLEVSGTPKDRDEVNRREVCECDGWVYDLDTTGVPSIFNIIRSTVVVTRRFPY